MKLPNPVEIDLLTFIKTGQFDYLKLGQTKEWILNNFPDPDDTYSNNYEAPIWFYGNIELHFHDNEKLFLIHCDHIDTLDGGKNLELKKWIFSEPKKLSLSFVVEQLNQQRIDFKVEHKAYGELSTVNITILRSGVKLGFSPIGKDEEELADFLERNRKEDSNLFLLHGFSLTST